MKRSGTISYHESEAIRLSKLLASLNVPSTPAEKRRKQKLQYRADAHVVEMDLLIHRNKNK